MNLVDRINTFINKRYQIEKVPITFNRGGKTFTRLQSKVIGARDPEEDKKRRALYVRERTSPEERRKKYSALRAAGLSSARASQARDWTIPAIKQRVKGFNV